MKHFLLFVLPFIIGSYFLLSMAFSYTPLGPLDTFPRTIQTVKCQNGVEAKVYRKKMIASFLIGTDNRLEIKKDGQIILDERLYWADIWKDVEPENLTFKCEDNEIKTSSNWYFDNTYKINTDGTIIKEKKFTW